MTKQQETRLANLSKKQSVQTLDLKEQGELKRLEGKKAAVPTVSLPLFDVEVSERNASVTEKFPERTKGETLEILPSSERSEGEAPAAVPVNPRYVFDA